MPRGARGGDPLDLQPHRPVLRPRRRPGSPHALVRRVSRHRPPRAGGPPLRTPGRRCSAPRHAGCKRARFDDPRRTADPRPAQAGLRTRPARGLAGRGPRQAVPAFVRGGQARAHRHRHRHESGVGGVRGRDPCPPDLRGSGCAHRAARRGGRDDQAVRTPPRVPPHRADGDREPYPGACPPDRRRARGPRDLPRRGSAPSRRGGRRRVLDGQPRAGDLRRPDARSGTPAPAAPHVHGRSRRSPRHRAQRRQSARRLPVRRGRPRRGDRGGPAPAHHGGGRGGGDHRPAGRRIHGLDAGAPRVLDHRPGAGIGRRRRGGGNGEGAPPAA